MSALSSAPGKWGDPRVPKSGWSCIEVDDFEEPNHTCEMCEIQECRYVHTMSHPRYVRELLVGCICAGRMEGDADGARHREAQMKAKAARRERWLMLEWRLSRAGNTFINTRDGFNVVVYPRGAIWGAKVLDRETGRKRISSLPYKSKVHAQLAAFEVVNDMKMRREQSL